MRNIFLVLMVLSAVSCRTCFAASSLREVRFSENADIARVVFEVSGEASYSWEREGDTLSLFLKGVTFKSSLKPPDVSKSAVVDSVVLEASSEGVIAKVNLKFPSYCIVFPLYYPGRVVVDLRKGLKEFKREKVAPGLEWVRVATKTGAGPVVGTLLRVNPAYFDVFPALAAGKPYEPGFFESILLFFKPVLPWVEESTTHFYKERTSSMSRRYGAAAAVNGTYFGKAGEPLGLLMINREIVSSPIHDRTALVIDEFGKPYIDNILVNTYFVTSDGIKVEITAFNQKRMDGDVILYTSKFGAKTSTKDCVEARVVGGRIEDVCGGNSSIPSNGYVISCPRGLLEVLRRQMASGNRISVKLELIPYGASSDGGVRHIIGGGPRLLKAGRIYVSKREEKFKSDITSTHASRMAAGVTRDGQLLFVAIDRTSRIADKSDITPSAGMSLEELSHFLLSLGVLDAVNLDGGGSTTMVVSGEVVNTPANGSEIAVSNAIVIKRKF